MGDGKWRGWPVGALLCLFVALLGCGKDSEPPAAEAVPASVGKVASRSGTELPQVKVERGEFVDARDSQLYAFVRFDSMFERTDSGYRPLRQVWMAENLRYQPPTHEEPGHPGAWCSSRGGDPWFASMALSTDDEAFCREGRGLVYRWTAAMGLDDSVVTDSGPRSLRYDSAYSYMRWIQPLHQGICPDGWRLPTKADWEVLLSNLERNRRFLPATFHWPPMDSGCEGEGCGEDVPDPPPEVLSYLKARVDDLPQWGKEIDLADPYGFGLLPRYAFWTTTLDSLRRDDDYPNAPRVSVFVDPSGQYWGWQARFRYWNVPGSLQEGNFVRCIR